MQQRLAAVGEMAAGIAHEIRNPLASMSGSMQMLRQELALTGDQAQLMDIVLKESDRLNQTIKSFLAYAAPAAGAVRRGSICGRWSTRPRCCCGTARMSASGTRSGVAAPMARCPFEGDESQLRQILWNLATNGVRAMRHGGELRLGAAWNERPTADPGTLPRNHRPRRRHDPRRARRHLPALPRLVRSRAPASASPSCTASSPTTAAGIDVQLGARAGHDVHGAVSRPVRQRFLRAAAPPPVRSRAGSA